MGEFFCYEKIVTINCDSRKLEIIYTEDCYKDVPNVFHKNDIINFDYLSFGEQFVIKLFYRLICDLKYNSFVIIDEPETALHVEWQELLIENIVKVASEYGLKILIATHSPYIINNLNVDVGCVENEEKL